ncbi:hypothetical protein [Pelodictyon luteolum]|nr:hypothetical protein [Pelodictyon luteolum]
MANEQLNMTMTRTGHIMILGCSHKTVQLQDLLGKKGHMVSVAGNHAAYIDAIEAKPPYEITILTDSFDDALNSSLLTTIRTSCQPGNIICLCSGDSPETERLIRSSGPVFYGSCESFIAEADRIIQSSLAASGSRASDKRAASAKMLEQRLLTPPPFTSNSLRCQIHAVRTGAVTIAGRSMEVLMALTLLTLTGLPVLLVLAARKLLKGTPVLDTVSIRTSTGTAVKAYRFHSTGHAFRDIPLAVLILLGKLSIIDTNQPDHNSVMQWNALIRDLQ